MVGRSRNSFAPLVLALMLLELCAHPAAWGATLTPMSVYHVGNSLTYHITAEDRLKNEAALRGIDMSYGYHIRCGAGLHDISAFPTDTCVPVNAYGYWGQALPNNHWDAVTLQTFGDSLAD